MLIGKPPYFFIIRSFYCSPRLDVGPNRLKSKQVFALLRGIYGEFRNIGNCLRL